ncbi:MAG: NYN domain-containing protein [Candidatus Colwellbacteria bacterium]|nr:NYN domain-containing protein [Candidatus Colwellbacteria bacterium]
MDNIAFIDGQNLFLGTTKCDVCAARLNISIKNIKLTDCTCGNAWEVNLKKFRIYLRDNYNIKEAYYVLGFQDGKNNSLYLDIQKAGFLLLFKEHSCNLKSDKKGNVDTDIVFEVMKSLIDNGSDFNKIVLVSGDGDYKKLVDYLVSKDRFCKILFPNKKYASSLYFQLGSEYFDFLEIIKSYLS